MRTLLVSLMGILAPALLVGAQAAFGQDNCSDILQHGIYEEFLATSATISHEVVRSQYCSQSSQSSSDDQGINLDSLSQNGRFQGAWSSSPRIWKLVSRIGLVLNRRSMGGTTAEEEFKLEFPKRKASLTPFVTFSSNHEPLTQRGWRNTDANSSLTGENAKPSER